MKAPIKVEQHHIDHAIQNDSHHCMIADAIRDHYQDAKYIVVDLQSIRFSFLGDKTTQGVRHKYFTPPKAQLALLKFDQGEEVRPFSFDLGKPVITKAGWWAKNRKPKAERWKPKKGHVPNRNRLTQE